MEWRFSSTFAEIANNLTTHVLLPRNGALANLQGHISTAQTTWFASVAAGDLHLQPAGVAAVDSAALLPAG